MLLHRSSPLMHIKMSKYRHAKSKPWFSLERVKNTISALPHLSFNVFLFKPPPCHRLLAASSSQLEDYNIICLELLLTYLPSKSPMLSSSLLPAQGHRKLGLRNNCHVLLKSRTWSSVTPCLSFTTIYAQFKNLCSMKYTHNIFFHHIVKLMRETLYS